MRRSKNAGGRYTVTGPYEEDHPVPNIRAGISAAQTFATRHRRHDGELTYYVRDLLQDTTYATITKGDDGVIRTLPQIAA